MKIPSPILELSAPLYSENEVKVFLKRDDLIHSDISGNKWRKLKFNVEKFKSGRFEHLLTFGGAFSNHIAATAAVGKELGVSTIGVIRGDELRIDSNSTLMEANRNGMKLVFTSREEYDLKEEKYYQEELRDRHGHIWIVPEGGANFYGTLGCQEICKEIEFDFQHLFVASGTGTTAAGLLASNHKAVIHSVSVLKKGSFLNDNIVDRMQEVGWAKEDIVDKMNSFELLEDYHFGGYAKYNQLLINFMNDFYVEHKIALDHVYTAKMMYAMHDQILQGKIENGSSIVALHTGGLQGNHSIEDLLVFK